MSKRTSTTSVATFVNSGGLRRIGTNRAAHAIRLFQRAEAGSLIIFSLFIFVLMLMICGMALDVMRFETTRTKIQNTADRAALAAASLTQSVAPAAVVQDYMDKEGLSEFLDAVHVSEGISSRAVTVDTSFNMPTHFFNMMGIETLSGPVNAAARESIGNVEISLVLDVSGSMNRYNRLGNLKVAAADFIDTIYDAAEAGAVSTSVIPYNTQVNAGATLLSHYTLDDGAHDYSHCVNFQAEDYRHPGLSTTQVLQQTMHFDPWSDARQWSPGDDLRTPVCPAESSREILPWSDNPQQLKNHIAAFQAWGNTSIDIGLKWGSVLLDPGSRIVASDMISSGHVDPDLHGRPYNYNDTETMKIMVVMTDGVNTSQYYVKDSHRSGPTDVWYDPGSDRVSVWSGEGPVPVAVNDWELPNDEFFRTVNRSWGDQPTGAGAATRLTFPELWANVPIPYHAKSNVYPMNWNAGQRNAILNAAKYVPSSAKNTRMSQMCAAAKAQGVIIFSVGLEVPDSSADLMRNCASSPAHFFRVEGLDIGYAFRAIAGQINQLRLTN